jgi:hypothetical protein
VIFIKKNGDMPGSGKELKENNVQDKVSFFAESSGFRFQAFLRTPGKLIFSYFCHGFRREFVFKDTGKRVNI